ncbi:MAG: sigma-54-dependent Fis family transcriptional regulator [bacterium]|nr:sigma-54-dependent Fis family transcriptional regulator [bacterium]
MEKSQKSHPVLPILLLDDDKYALKLYKSLLLSKGITNLIGCQNGREALETLSSHKVSIIVLDLHMPEMSGEQVLSILSAEHPQIPVIISTSVDEVKTAVRCMQSGAFDYIVKPIESNRFMTTVRRALEFWELRQENVLLKEHVLESTIKQPGAFSEIITNNPAMRSIFKYIESIAATSQPVLITGETGVGKELIARAIHRLSGCKGELVAVNVAGLDDPTFSDTLFGHKRGAFTGADRARDGLIETASNGTLFLDEIGDLPPTSQVKLLRLLQERKYYPLGADVPRTTNARIIVATNRDLLALQKSEKFRTDLYYRLLLHRINVPPLRKRRDDIPLLVDFFLQNAAEELQKAKPIPLPELFTLFSVYGFPGNIRELQAMIFDAVSRHVSGELSLESFQEIMQHSHSAKEDSGPTASFATLEVLYTALDSLPTLKAAEDLLIREALKRTGDNRTLTATLLGTTRQKLYRWLQAAKHSS